MNVLHVTQALAGGVLSSLENLVSGQLSMGYSVTVVHVRRQDTPSAQHLSRLFGSRVRIVEIPGPLPVALWRLGRFTREWLARENERVVHTHSSLAGVAVRLPVVGVRTRDAGRTFYSPHGYAFQRLDIGPGARFAFLMAERVLSHRATSVLVSHSEDSLAQKTVRAHKRAVLLNTVDVSTLPRRSDRDPTQSRLRVGMAGRVTFQKAPWRFAETARELSGRAEFLWIGGGPEEDVTRWLHDSPVQVTGWQSRQRTLELIASCDVFYFPTLWEGLPVTLLEAQALGIPCVATDIPGNQDAIVHRVTGLLADSDDELTRSVELLLVDASKRATLGKAAAEHIRSTFVTDVGARSHAIYSAGRA